jgi:cytochrome b
MNAAGIVFSVLTWVLTSVLTVIIPSRDESAVEHNPAGAVAVGRESRLSGWGLTGV